MSAHQARCASTPVWALVPAKSFARAKSRLSEVLDDRARAALARSMFDHVLGVLRASPEVAGVMVVTDGEDVAIVARAHGAEVVRDAESPPLGAIVDAALVEVEQRGATAALVVMADLPELHASDVDRLVRALAQSALVIAPDLRGDGTNALGLRPPSLLRTSFGNRDSFARHLHAAAAAGLHPTVHRSDGLGFDVDEPADLSRLSPGFRGG